MNRIPEWYNFQSIFWDCLRDFTCARIVDADTPYAQRYGNTYYLPWEFEVQGMFNAAIALFNPDNQALRMYAAVDYDSEKDPILYGAVWIGVNEGRWVEPRGAYQICYIARAIKYRECRIGDLLLDHALYACWMNHQRFGGLLQVTALIDYRNESSIKLFERHGFTRMEHTGYIEGRYIEYALPEDSPEWESMRNLT